MLGVVTICVDFFGYPSVAAMSEWNCGVDCIGTVGACVALVIVCCIYPLPSLSLKILDLCSIDTIPSPSILSMDGNINPALVHGTYCASLRDRPIWNAIGPVLTRSSTCLEGELHWHLSDSMLIVPERNLGLFDLSVHLQSRPQHVSVILLSESSIDSSTKTDTISRLKQIIETAPQQGVVAFLLSEGSFANASERYQLDGFLSLQILYPSKILWLFKR